MSERPGLTCYVREVAFEPGELIALNP